MDKQAIIHYDGLYGDREARSDSAYIFLEEIVTRSEAFNWSIKPHVHSELVQIFIIEEGSLEFQTENQCYSISYPSIIFIPPSRLHGLIYNPQIRGQILTFSRRIFEDIFNTSERSLSGLEIEIISNFTETSFQTFTSILDRIRGELFGDRFGRELILRAELVRFVVEILRLRKKANMKERESSISRQHFLKFQKLLDQSDYSKSLKQYAAELCISSVHLNRICKTYSGKSAIKVIQLRIVDEACKYLRHTSYSISEIAYKLHFEYPNYFARFFRKHTGLSPQEFRKQNA